MTCMARLAPAGYGEVRFGRAWPGKAWFGRARHDMGSGVATGHLAP